MWLCVCTAQCKANCTGVSCEISVVMSTVYVGCHAPVEPHLIGCCRQPCFKSVKCTKALTLRALVAGVRLETSTAYAAGKDRTFIGRIACESLLASSLNLNRI